MTQVAGGQKAFDPRSSSTISGTTEDAKHQVYRIAVGAGATFQLDVSLAESLFIDEGPTVLGDLQLRFDACTLAMNARRGLYIRTMPYRRLEITNTTGGPVTVGLVCSNNPRFLVIGNLA